MRALNLEEDDIVVGMVPVMENTTVLTVSENGQGRRTDPAEYRLQSRGGKGIKNYDTQKNGPVAGVLAVGEEDDVILISDDGIIIRIPVAEISTQSRYAGGVRVMRIGEGSRLVSLCRAPHEDEEEAAAESEAPVEAETPAEETADSTETPAEE